MIGASAQKLAERGDIQAVMSRGEPRQVPLSEAKQTNCGRQTPAVLRVRGVFESFLKMNESPSRLDQSFEIVCIRRFSLEPKLLQDIVRLVVTFFIPAVEKRAIEWMLCNVSLVWIDVFGKHLGNEPRNPLAFVHEELNLLAAQIMSKPARTTLSEVQDRPPHAVDTSQPTWLCQHKK